MKREDLEHVRVALQDARAALERGAPPPLIQAVLDGAIASLGDLGRANGAAGVAHGCTHLRPGCCPDRRVCVHGVACTHGSVCHACWEAKCPEASGQRSLTPGDALEWIATLDCSEAPFSCGRCIPCRARQSLPELYERCPGSGERTAVLRHRTCDGCRETFGTVDGVVPEHWRDRATAILDAALLKSKG